MAVIQAVDDFQDLLRLSAATAGNDHRLGANEAPPAVVSIFLGDELNAVLEAIESDSKYEEIEKTIMRLGVDVIPGFSKDTTDRNRTSPFAFTGNKFEFRMLGSSNSISCTNIMLNAAVADTLKKYADELEGAKDFDAAVHALIKKTIQEHKRIIFNGNGYDDAWLEEAKRRGLLNYKTTPDCMPHLLDKKNVDMLTSHNVMSVSEVESRCEIMLENYVKSVLIEAKTMVDMTKKQILPAIEAYISELVSVACSKKALDEGLVSNYEKKTIGSLSVLTDCILTKAEKLCEAVEGAAAIEDYTEAGYAVRDNVVTRMAELRAVCDEAELAVGEKYWPFPTYGDLLFGVC